MHDFERRPHVIVEPPHHARTYLECNAAIAQHRANGVEMRAAVRAQMLLNRGQRVDNGLVLSNFAVENTQRVRFRAALAIAAQLRSDGPETFAKKLHELRPAVLVAHGVEQQLEAAQSRFTQNIDHHFDYFDIGGGRVRSDRFSADLKELPVPAFLRPLTAEHRPAVVELLQPRPLIEAVLDVCAHHRSRRFRSQRERAAVAVLERVHLLPDDIGLFADTARKQGRFLEDRRPDLLVVVAPENVARDRFDMVPHRARRRENIPRPLYRFNHYAVLCRSVQRPHSAARWPEISPFLLRSPAAAPSPACPSPGCWEGSRRLRAPAQPPQQSSLCRSPRRSARSRRCRSDNRLPPCIRAASPGGP